MTILMPEPITWWEDDPQRFAAEHAALAEAAPGLQWLGKYGVWLGPVPLWPFGRPQPPGLVRISRGQPLTVMIRCWQMHPMLSPSIQPLSVQLQDAWLGLNTWHLLPNGSLCLFRGASHWDPTRLIAGLVPKISGWYIELLLVLCGQIPQMPDRGVDVDGEIDDKIDEAARLIV